MMSNYSESEIPDQKLNASQKTLNFGPNFLDNIELIDELIEKQRNKWTLTALVWMDWSDIAQILRIHIHKKWHLYDKSRSLGPWVSTLISNQISNLIESKYTNYVRPCGRCDAAFGDDGCSIYGQQGVSCPLYAKWMKAKGNALHTKLPVSLEDHAQEVYDLPDLNEDITAKIAKFHGVILPLLALNERLVYQWAYVDEKEDAEIKTLMDGMKMDEKYLWKGKLKTIKLNIVEKAKKILREGDL